MTVKQPEKLTEIQRQKLMGALDKIDQDILEIERELQAMGYPIPALAPSRKGVRRVRLQKCRDVMRSVRFGESLRLAKRR